MQFPVLLFSPCQILSFAATSFRGCKPCNVSPGSYEGKVLGAHSLQALPPVQRHHVTVPVEELAVQSAEHWVRRVLRKSSDLRGD